MTRTEELILRARLESQPLMSLLDEACHYGPANPPDIRNRRSLVESIVGHIKAEEAMKAKALAEMAVSAGGEACHSRKSASVARSYEEV